MSRQTDSLIAGDGGVPASPQDGVQDALVSEILALFQKELAVQVESPHVDLFQSGVFDSMTLVVFILALETRFGLRFPMDELELDSVVSVVKIAELVAGRKRAAALEGS
ncbi:MAG TPA: phosphopantetheine-binding protein [Terriglobia bacterium]|nr:phosphopantetheine-binding protein [Terriglobia bacterium]